MHPIEQEAWDLYQQQAADSPYLVKSGPDLTIAQRTYWIRRVTRRREESFYQGDVQASASQAPDGTEPDATGGATGLTMIIGSERNFPDLAVSTNDLIKAQPGGPRLTTSAHMAKGSHRSRPGVHR
jgi:hypothetical protein